MAEGLRLHQPDRLFWGTIQIINHPRKNYFVHVDGLGDAYVCHEVWVRLQEADEFGADHGLEVVNTVPDPPHLFIGFGVEETKPTRQKIERAVRDIAPSGTKVTIRS